VDDGDVLEGSSEGDCADELREVTAKSMMQPGSLFASYQRAEERPEFSGRRALQMEEPPSTRYE
jgi:hypothetical protein